MAGESTYSTWLARDRGKEERYVIFILADPVDPNRFVNQGGLWVYNSQGGKESMMLFCPEFYELNPGALMLQPGAPPRDRRHDRDAFGPRSL